MSRSPATTSWVVAQLRRGGVSLHPKHRELLSAYRVEPYSTPVGDCPGESVIVVAQIDEEVLYHSDVEDGWELERPTLSSGMIRARGCNQFELGHIVDQKCGSPCE
jgi:hypothetical protein